MSEFCLLVDTTLSGVALGLTDLESGQLIGSESDEDLLGGSKSLTEKLKILTDLHKISASEIRYLCVSTGPGSFTGIKVGLAFVYGLLRGGNSLSLPVSSLGLIASRLVESHSNVAVFLPATKSRGALALATKDDLEILDTDINNAELMSALHDRTVVLLKPWTALQELLTKSGVPYEVLKPGVVLEKSMETMSAKAVQSFAKGAYVKQLPVPFYLRKSAAEEKLEQKGV